MSKAWTAVPLPSLPSNRLAVMGRRLSPKYLLTISRDSWSTDNPEISRHFWADSTKRSLSVRWSMATCRFSTPIDLTITRLLKGSPCLLMISSLVTIVFRDKRSWGQYFTETADSFPASRRERIIHNASQTVFIDTWNKNTFFSNKYWILFKPSISWVWYFFQYLLQLLYFTGWKSKNNYHYRLFLYVYVFLHGQSYSAWTPVELCTPEIHLFFLAKRSISWKLFFALFGHDYVHYLVFELLRLTLWALLGRRSKRAHHECEYNPRPCNLNRSPPPG